LKGASGLPEGQIKQTQPKTNWTAFWTIGIKVTVGHFWQAKIKYIACSFYILIVVCPINRGSNQFLFLYFLIIK
jgi:hypothetical protein